MHAPYILSADDLDDSLDFYRKPSILAADDFLGACYRKAMTPKKLWTLLFPHKNKIGTSTPPPSKNARNPPPLQGEILWAWGFSC